VWCVCVICVCGVCVCVRDVHVCERAYVLCGVYVLYVYVVCVCVNMCMYCVVCMCYMCMWCVCVTRNKCLLCVTLTHCLFSSHNLVVGDSRWSFPPFYRQQH